MAEVTGAVIRNVLLYVVIVVAPTVAFLVASRLPSLGRRLKLRLWPPPPVPKHPPIEKLAADLRRVHRLLAQFEQGTSAVRRIGARQAYDALLVEACDVVEVEQRLHEVPEGIEREVERLRLEESLRAAGLMVP